MRAVLIIVLALMAQWATAIDINVTQGRGGLHNISIVPFAWQGAPLPLKPGDVVRSDLRQSGEFRAINPHQMLSSPSKLADIYFKNWRLLKQDYVVVGEISAVNTQQNLFRIDFDLINVSTEKVMLTESVQGSAEQLRSMAHSISDLIYERITGVQGVFNTQIAFVSRIIKDGQTQQEIQVMDADGERIRTIARRSAPIISLAWSFDKKQLAYASTDNGQWKVYIQELKTGRTKVAVDYRDAINSAPAFSPDGKFLAFQSTKTGNFEIYVKNLKTGQVKRITQHRAVDTEPSWSPDGKKLVFTSDRSGRPQVYEADVSNGRVQRLTFEGAYNAKPSYSADGRYVVTVSQQNGRFNIAALDLESGLMRVLSSTASDESPSVAPNASNLIYSTKKGEKSVLAWVSIDGKVTKSMPVEANDVREPAWSPY